MNDKINELYNNLDAKDKIINEQALEIARLKDREKEIMDKYFYQSKYASEMEDKYITENVKVKEAIKYINNASYFDGSSMCANDLLQILGDKE